MGCEIEWIQYIFPRTKNSYYTSVMHSHVVMLCIVVFRSGLLIRFHVLDTGFYCIVNIVTDHRPRTLVV